MEDQHYRQLVQRFIDKKLTDEELEVFIHLLNENKLDDYLREAMNEDAGLVDTAAPPAPKPVLRVLWVRWAVAAMLVLAAGFAFYFNYNRQDADLVATLEARKTDPVLPGADKAVLILGDGRQVVLKEQVYNAAADEKRALGKRPGVEYNEIKTPRGGQYRVILPDGSKAFLNAASGIRFPLAFAGDERRVEITGEVFFEVAPNKKMPFRVLAANQTVEVLGTHFNVNAYADEVLTKTTLLEGSVKVSAPGAGGYRVLRPGQQAVSGGDAVGLRVQAADVEGVVAWKNGYFKLNRVDVKTLMRQIARWYDIEVEYRGKVPQDELMGKIRRSDDITEVLRILEIGKIPFEMEGRKLIVGN